MTYPLLVGALLFWIVSLIELLREQHHRSALYLAVAATMLMLALAVSR